MKYFFEWKTERGFDVYPGDYFSSSVLSKGEVLAQSAGFDQFDFSSAILPEKRIAGFGRNRNYRLEDPHLGFAPLEAAPSRAVELEGSHLSELNLTFKLATNIILDQGLLAQQLSLHITGEDGICRQIPLSRPDVAIDWHSRGNYIVHIPF